MKVAAAAGIFCLIMTVVNGSTFYTAAEYSQVDGKEAISCSEGQWVIQCSVDWEDGQRYTSNLGDKELHLPSVNGGYCADCGECTTDGMGCVDVYQERPGCPGFNFG